MPQWIIVGAARSGNRWDAVDGECEIATADDSETALRDWLNTAYGDQLGMDGDTYLVLPLDGAEIFNLIPKSAYDVKHAGVVKPLAPKLKQRTRKP